MSERKDAAEYLKQLDRALEEWGKLSATISAEQWQSDLNKGKKAVYALLVALQAAIDIASYLITAQNWGKPISSGEAFEILSAEGVLSSEIGSALADLAGLHHSSILHLYWQTEPEQLCQLVQQNFPYLQQFRARVADLL